MNIKIPEKCLICDGKIIRKLSNFASCVDGCCRIQLAWNGSLLWIEFNDSENERYLTYYFEDDKTHYSFSQQGKYSSLNGIINFPTTKKQLFELYDRLKRNQIFT